MTSKRTKAIQKINLMTFMKLLFISEACHQDLVWYCCIQPRESPLNVHKSISFEALTLRVLFLKTFAHKHWYNYNQTYNYNKNTINEYTVKAG